MSIREDHRGTRYLHIVYLHNVGCTRDIGRLSMVGILLTRLLNLNSDQLEKIMADVSVCFLLNAIKE